MNYESSVEYKQQMFSAVSSGSGLGWGGGGGTFDSNWFSHLCPCIVILWRDKLKYHFPGIPFLVIIQIVSACL